MNSIWKRNGLILLFFLFLGGSFGAGWYLGAQNATEVPIEGVINTELGADDGVDFSLFWDAWRKIQTQYVGADELDFQEMVFGAISGMVDSLDDPYTVFMDPEDAKKFAEDVQGVFGGVGMEIGIREGELKVIAPLDGTPAAVAGLRPGDSIIKIDDMFSKGLTIDGAVTLIRGDPGTQVTLHIFRDGWLSAKDFTITRDLIEVPSITWEIREGNVAYIRLHQFFQKAGTDFNKTANEVLRSDADRIVLDMRSNPGGFLDVSVHIAGWFLERGDLVTLEDFGGKRENIEYKAKGNAKLKSYPIVVLINEGSASASEILAGALRDQNGATLLGKQSFGKGSVQELANLKNGATLKVTVANWLTPNGAHITDVGLTPDVEVDITEEDFNQELDPQIDKAIELVKKL